MLNPFARRDNPHALVVGMTGVKMGDRLVQVGCAHGGRLAAVAGKVGLSGRAVAVVPDEASAARVRKGAAQAGVLVEIEIAPPTDLRTNTETFDVAIVDDLGGLAGSMPEEGRAALVREIRRVLRPGGRVVFIGAAPPSGIGALFKASSAGPPYVVSGGASTTLTAGGFRSARMLANRDGLVFVEAIKPR